MTDFNRIDSSNLDAFVLTTGTQVLANKIMTSGALTTLGCTLVSGTTYVFPFGAQHGAVPSEVPLTAIAARWDAAAILTITVEDALFPATIQRGDPRGAPQLTDFDATAGFWIQEQPPNAYVPVVGGTYNPTTNTVSAPGGSAGGCIFHLGMLGTPRGRIKVVVGGTGGVVRVGVWGKAAA